MWGLRKARSIRAWYRAGYQYHAQCAWNMCIAHIILLSHLCNLGRARDRLEMSGHCFALLGRFCLAWDLHWDIPLKTAASCWGSVSKVDSERWLWSEREIDKSGLLDLVPKAARCMRRWWLLLSAAKWLTVDFSNTNIFLSYPGMRPFCTDFTCFLLAFLLSFYLLGEWLDSFFSEPALLHNHWAGVTRTGTE